MITLINEFERFIRVFENTPPLLTASDTIQQVHAQKIQKWLELVNGLEASVKTATSETSLLLTRAIESARGLFIRGDDISAWLGQRQIVRVAELVTPGIVAGYQLSVAARFSAYLFFHDDATEYLERMREHVDEDTHHLVHIYWELKGLILSLQRNWYEALPCYQLSLEHLEQSTPHELAQWSKIDRETLLADRLIHIADCWIRLGWHSEGSERNIYIRKAENTLERAKTLRCRRVEKYLIRVNEIEILLLKDELENAKQQIDGLMDWDAISSERVATLFPLAYCLRARIADIEGEQTAMLSFLSQSLAESNLFHHVLQEFQIIDFSLELIQKHAIERRKMEPLFRAMVMMLEAKDWYTGRGHSMAVANLTTVIYSAWQNDTLTPDQREELYWAAYLHDIGKLRLPRSLLNKIAPLGDTEFHLLRKHPVFSSEILHSMGNDRIARLVIEHHQDALGKGYPGKEPASPMGLCIALADILEASTSTRRKYKTPKTVSQVLKELENMGEGRYPQSLLATVDRICAVHD